MSNVPTYEPRVVAFLDILGFFAFVERAARDPAILSFLFNVLSVIRLAEPYRLNLNDLTISSLLCPGIAYGYRVSEDHYDI